MVALALIAALVAGAAPAGLGPSSRATDSQTGQPSALWALQSSVQQSSGEVVASILVHGNHLTPDADIIELSGLTIGQEFGPTTLADVAARLKQAKTFDDVTVLKRYASISDPTQVVIVIIVDEGPVRLDVPDDPSAPIRVVKRKGLRNLMWLPILDAEDGYGVTYGVQLALANVGSPEGRVTFPLSWGGLKQAGTAYDRPFSRGPLSRLQVGAGVDRQRNPAFDENLDRRRVWTRGERGFGDLRVGATAGLTHVAFAGTDDTIRSIGADVRLDTRLDPVLPRNAVDATASIERLAFRSGGALDRTHVGATGYLGLIGQMILVAGVARDSASDPLPPYLKNLLGGWSTLRGFEAGSFAGDTTVHGTLEVRMPITSVLGHSKLGVSVFADTGKAYDRGQRFDDVDLRTGVGASVWVAVTSFRVSVAVAHGLGADTRINFGAGFGL